MFYLQKLIGTILKKLDENKRWVVYAVLCVLLSLFDQLVKKYFFWGKNFLLCIFFPADLIFFQPSFTDLNFDFFLFMISLKHIFINFFFAFSSIFCRFVTKKVKWTPLMIFKNSLNNNLMNNLIF